MKKYIFLLLALSIIFTLCVSAFAASEISGEGDASSDVRLDAEAAAFSVTVPTSLDMALAANGAVTCATNAKIVNNGYAPVEVTAIAVNDAAGWTKVAFSDAATFKTYKVDSKRYAMKIGAEGKLQDASEALTEAGGIIKTCIDGGAELPFSYAGLVSAFSEAKAGETVATVVFTVGWVAAA